MESEFLTIIDERSIALSVNSLIRGPDSVRSVLVRILHLVL